MFTYFIMSTSTDWKISTSKLLGTSGEHEHYFDWAMFDSYVNHGSLNYNQFNGHVQNRNSYVNAITRGVRPVGQPGDLVEPPSINPVRSGRPGGKL